MNEWVNSSERLPTEDGYYLICPPYYSRATVAFWDSKAQRWIKSEQYWYSKEEMRYWMALPEVPEVYKPRDIRETLCKNG